MGMLLRASLERSGLVVLSFSGTDPSPRRSGHLFVGKTSECQPPRAHFGYSTSPCRVEPLQGFCIKLDSRYLAGTVFARPEVAALYDGSGQTTSLVIVPNLSINAAAYLKVPCTL
jgi:hypothetical protein